MVQHTHPSHGEGQGPAHCKTQAMGAGQSWMQVDLGTDMCFRPNHYCIRNSSDSNGALRNWELQGSCDGDTWHTLRRHEGDETISHAEMGTGHWQLDACTADGGAFRYFRIWQFGPNWYGTHTLHCSGIELYGLLDVPKVRPDMTIDGLRVATEKVVDPPLQGGYLKASHLPPAPLANVGLLPASCWLLAWWLVNILIGLLACWLAGVLDLIVWFLLC